MSANPNQKPAALGIIGFMIAAVVFAGLAGVLLSQLLEQRYADEPVHPIVVLQRDIPAGEPLSDKDLALANWPQSAIPKGAFATVEKAFKTGGTPIIPLVKGEALLKSHLAEQANGMGIAPQITAGHRAMSVRVDDAVAMSRLVYPGARIDILSTVRGSGMATRIVLQNVKVLAVGQDIDPLTIVRRRRLKREREAEEGGSSGGFNPNDSDSKEMRGVLTLEVKPEEAERLALAVRDGKIDIALRNPSNKKLVETPGVTRLALMGAEEGGPMEQWAFLLSQMGGMQAQRAHRPVSRTSSPKKRRSRRRVAPKPAAEKGPAVRIFRGGK